jgi:hypothetical protein
MDPYFGSRFWYKKSGDELERLLPMSPSWDLNEICTSYTIISTEGCQRLDPEKHFRLDQGGVEKSETTMSVRSSMGPYISVRVFPKWGTSESPSPFIERSSLHLCPGPLISTITVTFPFLLPCPQALTFKNWTNQSPFLKWNDSSPYSDLR